MAARLLSSVVVLAFAVGPPPSFAAAPQRDGAYADPTRELGATSPSCRYALDPIKRRSCREAGSAVHPHPLSSYGLDVRSGFSITDPGTSFLSAIQTLAAGLWMGALYLLNGVLLLLEWSFSLDMTGKAMPEARRTLAQLHSRVFGDAWLLLGISVVGVWGMWRGLVQRRATETLGGLAATVGLMVVALVLISAPAATVGRAAALANDGGLAVLAAATTGAVDRPRPALVESLGGVFDVTVRQPWCALQFGSAAYCDQRTGDARRPTNAELWLAYPAQSWQRERLYREVRGDDDGGFDPIGGAGDLLGLTDDRELPDDVRRLAHKDRERVRMQEAGGTFPRLALLGVIGVGLLGAAALYAYLAIRLLLAGGLTLLLLLLAPAMLIAPAFGESGRATFLSWIKRLIGALAAKLIYSVFLAAVLAASRAFVGLEIGWFGTWLVLAAFWWGIFIKRDEIIGFVSAGVPGSDGRGLGQALRQGYYGVQLGRAVRHAGHSVVAPPRRAAAGLAAWRTEGREARAAATTALARERLDQQGRSVLGAEQEQARGLVVRRGALGRELRALDRRLQGFDEAAAAARARGSGAPAPTRDQQALLRRRAELRAALESPVAREAGEVIRHAERTRAQTGESISERDLAAYRARRSADLRADLPLDHERNLRAADVDPREYAQAPLERRDQMLDQVRATRDADRDLLTGVEHAGERKAAQRRLDGTELRRRAAEERRRIREERRRRRVREGVFRVR